MEHTAKVSILFYIRMVSWMSAPFMINHLSTLMIWVLTGSLRRMRFRGYGILLRGLMIRWRLGENQAEKKCNYFGFLVQYWPSNLLLSLELLFFNDINELSFRSYEISKE